MRSVNTEVQTHGSFGGSFCLALLLCFSVGWMWMARTRLNASPLGPPRNWPEMRVDLNHDPAARLMILPGIGEAIAQRIVEDREARGEFTSIDDLDRVPGIGARTIARVRPYLVEISVLGDTNRRNDSG